MDSLPEFTGRELLKKQLENYWSAPPEAFAAFIIFHNLFPAPATWVV